MRRLLHYLINNIREHLMLYLFLWGLLAIMDLIMCFIFSFPH
ncbi:YceO family protein [Escherichia coli]